MMNSKVLFSFLLLVAFKVYGFEVGSGSEFKFNIQNQHVDLAIYIAKVENKNLSVEMHFGAGQLMITNMWQQFEFELVRNQPLKVKSGYIQTSENKKPEIMNQESFQMNRGVQLEDFLFASEDKLQKMFVAEETVELIAGTIVAKHYQKETNGQVVDFWIASSVKPIGLVKLISKSETSPENNYTIELSSLIKNVKPTIDPSKAIPMSEETQKKLKNIR